MSLYYIKTGIENMQIDSVAELLGKSYWAKSRSKEVIEKSMENSLCYGAFLNETNKQIGFARVITDYATTYYICDVIVAEEHRGSGIGKKLMESIESNAEISYLQGILATKDAHELYRKYGFRDGGSNFMSKPRKRT